MVVSVQERMGGGPNSKVTAPRVHQDVQLMRTERPRHIKSACTLCWCKTKSVCGFHLRISLNNEIIASCPVSLQCAVSFPCALHALPWPRLSRSSTSSLHLSLLIFCRPVSVSLHGQSSQQILWMKPWGRLRKRNIRYLVAITKKTKHFKWTIQKNVSADVSTQASSKGTGRPIKLFKNHVVTGSSVVTVSIRGGK